MTPRHRRDAREAVAAWLPPRPEPRRPIMTTPDTSGSGSSGGSATTWQAPRQCVLCGQTGALQPRTTPITRKRRHKFGFLWLLLTLVTAGFGFLLWLVMPRYNETVSVDRYVVCTACGARQS